MADNNFDLIVEDVTDNEDQVSEPPRYKVFLHNDNYTTQDFVVAILMRIFNKGFEEAQSIMLKVHNTGIALCGVYTKEIAEAKVERVLYEANSAGFPLLCTMEEE